MTRTDGRRRRGQTEGRPAATGVGRPRPEVDRGGQRARPHPAPQGRPRPHVPLDVSTAKSTFLRKSRFIQLLETSTRHMRPRNGIF